MPDEIHTIDTGSLFGDRAGERRHGLPAIGPGRRAALQALPRVQVSKPDIVQPHADLLLTRAR
ncbi:hypothetical protein [Streptomyces bauhiniae]|nr:hypothetical protein [Streptomyces bauhiniae]